MGEFEQRLGRAADAASAPRPPAFTIETKADAERRRGERLWAAEGRELRLRAALEEGLTVRQAAKLLDVATVTLQCDMRLLGVVYKDYAEIRRTRLGSLMSGEHELSPNLEAALTMQMTRLHLEDLRAAYPGLRLGSLDIPEGHGTRVSHVFAEPSSASSAAFAVYG